MNKKRTKKGFTLVELIIVLAIFSIILTLVMSFIDPVSKLMTRASIKEKTAAYVDNIEEYIDNSIHYAKFIRVYDGGYCSASDRTVAVTDEADAVKSFVDWFLGGVVCPPDGAGNISPATGKVHVMKLINSGANAGHIYESVYDFTAAESYETLEGTGVYDAENNEIKKRVVKLRNGGAPSTITLSSTADVINPEHFENYDYYYKLGFYNLEPVPSGLADAGKNAYYSWLTSLTDNSGNKIEYDETSGKNFALNVVAYQKQSDGSGKSSVTYDQDGDGTNDTTEDIFKSPCHMSTASMAFINAIKTDEANSAPFYTLITNNKGILLDKNNKMINKQGQLVDEDGDLINAEGNKIDVAGGSPQGGYAVQFKEINSINMGLAFRIMNPDLDSDGIADDGDGNIYIIYILPEEIYDSQIIYK